MRYLILKNHQSLGDCVMLTGAVADLHAAFPGQYLTDVRTPFPDLWGHNPLITPLREEYSGVQTIDMRYDRIHRSNQTPYHFRHAFTQHLEDALRIRIPVTAHGGDIRVSAEEVLEGPPLQDLGVPARYWIVVSGGKWDYTAKWPHPVWIQETIRQTSDRIRWVQVGAADHHQPRMEEALDLVGRVSIRELVRLVLHADGVLCPVTAHMHLAAALPPLPGRPRLRAAVVLAGGRESPSWEAYPGQQFLHTVGQLPCCADGGCWRSRCQLVGDGDDKDTNGLCELPVSISPELVVPRCQAMLTPDRIATAVLDYYRGGALPWPTEQERTSVYA